MSIMEPLKRMDNSRWAMLISALLSLGLLSALIALGAITGVESTPEWLVGLFTVTGFVGGITAASTYMGRLLDGFISFFKTRGQSKYHIYVASLASLLAKTANEKTQSNTPQIGTKISKKEIIFTLVGVLFGIGIALTIALTGGIVPLAVILPFGFAVALFAFNCVNIFGGLANRLGSSLGVFTQWVKNRFRSDDEKNKKQKEQCVLNGKPPLPPRLAGERAAILLAIVAGVIITVALIASFAAGGVGVAGITAFFIGASKFACLNALLFGLSFTGLLASAVDYFARAACYLRHLVSKNYEVEYMQQKRHEYRGAFIGVILGASIGVVTIATLAILASSLFVGPGGAFALIMIFIAASSIFGGLGSRFGRLLDGFRNTQANLSKNQTPDTADISPALSALKDEPIDAILPIGLLDEDRVPPKSPEIQTIEAPLSTTHEARPPAIVRCCLV